MVHRILLISLEEATYRGNAVVCRQGDPVEHVIFVRTGSLAVVRAVDPAKADGKNQAHVRSTYAEMSSEVLEQVHGASRTCAWGPSARLNSGILALRP